MQSSYIMKKIMSGKIEDVKGLLVLVEKLYQEITLYLQEEGIQYQKVIYPQESNFRFLLL